MAKEIYETEAQSGGGGSTSWRPRGHSSKQVRPGSAKVEKGEKLQEGSDGVQWYGVGQDYGLARLGMDASQAQFTQNQLQALRNQYAQQLLNQLPEETRNQVLSAYIANRAARLSSAIR